MKFIDQIVRYAPNDIRFSFFSWKVALFGRFDIFHVHWPEFLVRHRTPFGTFLQKLLFRLFLLKLQLNRTPVVRTVHNIDPHDSGDASEKRLLSRLDRLASTHVVMNDCVTPTWPGRTVLIPHGHYRETFSTVTKYERVAGRVLLFGRLHPYKGILEFLKAAELLTMEGIEIRIVGAPTPEMRVQIEAELARPDRSGVAVSTDLRTVTNEEMVKEITEAHLIALPYQDAGNGNSGVAMVALSLGRPVLTTRSCVMQRLADEVGDQWVHMSDRAISADDIQSALTQTASSTAESHPVFAAGRDWPAVAREYSQVFSNEWSRSTHFKSS